MKNKNSAGIDGIHGDMIIKFGKSMLPWLLKMCKKTWINEHVPKNCRMTVKVPFYKSNKIRMIEKLLERYNCVVNWKVHKIIIINRMKIITNKLVVDVRERFWCK